MYTADCQASTQTCFGGLFSQQTKAPSCCLSCRMGHELGLGRLGSSNQNSNPAVNVQDCQEWREPSCEEYTSRRSAGVIVTSHQTARFDDLANWPGFPGDGMGWRPER
ncbi:hypothetical protein QC764_0050950 [Podospora pseudoanserina]|uniref:Uncharacterized protein n=1 Tax=Podospora pseudoanserina TaxID=2609844 RepID=A0ABR0ID28_9PEZI|nr:hypothetical protein QC764_0050950 [Podospora pseudoanserina]